MAQTPTDMQQATEEQPDMMQTAQQPDMQPEQLLSPTHPFSARTLAIAVTDSQIKLHTSILERHLTELSGETLKFEHLHETMSPLSSTSEPQKELVISVMPQNSDDLSNEDVVKLIQQTLGTIPIIKDQYNGLASGKVSGTSAAGLDAAAAEGKMGEAPQEEITGKKFSIDFPVGMNRTFKVKLQDLTIDELMQSVMTMPKAEVTRIGDLAEMESLLDETGTPATKGAAATAEPAKQDAAMVMESPPDAQQAMSDTGNKWSSKIPPKSMTPDGVLADKMVAGEKASNR